MWIQTGIELQDRFTAPILHMIANVHNATDAMAALHDTVSANINNSSFVNM